jgi:hypothetical protein
MKISKKQLKEIIFEEIIFETKREYERIRAQQLADGTYDAANDPDPARAAGHRAAVDADSPPAKEKKKKYRRWKPFQDSTNYDQDEESGKYRLRHEDAKDEKDKDDDDEYVEEDDQGEGDELNMSARFAKKGKRNFGKQKE